MTGKGLVIFSLFAVLLAVVGCEVFSFWQNDLQSFVEDGRSGVFVSNITYRGLAGGELPLTADGRRAAPSGSTVVAEFAVSNPRDLDLDYRVEFAGEPGLLLQEPGEITVGDNGRLSFECIPAQAAEQQELSFELSVLAIEAGR